MSENTVVQSVTSTRSQLSTTISDYYIRRWDYCNYVQNKKTVEENWEKVSIYQITRSEYFWKPRIFKSDTERKNYIATDRIATEYI